MNRLIDFGSDDSGVYPVSIFTDDILRVSIGQDGIDDKLFRVKVDHYEPLMTVVYAGDYKGACSVYCGLIRVIAEAREVVYENANRS